VLAFDYADALDRSLRRLALLPVTTTYSPTGDQPLGWIAPQAEPGSAAALAEKVCQLPC
jgi:hypothetical protein